ncbi:hypothetical protein Tco_1321178 [Tanacetum coccineum]
MENEHELSYETLTRVYLGSYEHYKGVVAEVEHSKPGFELQGAKMVEMGHDPRIIRSRERLLTWVIEGEVPLVPMFLLVLSVFAIDAACAFRAEEMPSLISCRMAAKVMAGVLDVDVLLGGILSTQDNA